MLMRNMISKNSPGILGKSKYESFSYSFIELKLFIYL